MPLGTNSTGQASQPLPWPAHWTNPDFTADQCPSEENRTQTSRQVTAPETSAVPATSLGPQEIFFQRGTNSDAQRSTSAEIHPNMVPGEKYLLQPKATCCNQTELSTTRAILAKILIATLQILIATQQISYGSEMLYSICKYSHKAL